VVVGLEVIGYHNSKLKIMKKYEVYFEIFGKKLKTTVDADNREQAKRIIRDKIIFHKIVIDIDNSSPSDISDEIGFKLSEDELDDAEFIKDMLGIKDSNKSHRQQI
jgi:hypothetical protein